MIWSLWKRKLTSFPWWWNDVRRNMLIWWGSLWCVFEPLTSSVADRLPLLKNDETQCLLSILWAIFGFLTVPISIFLSRPKYKFSYSIVSKDVNISICIGNAFEILIKQSDYALVIPINNEFDLTLGDRVLKSNSLQSQLIKKYFSHKPQHLQTEIESALNSNFYNNQIESIENDIKRYKNGTTVRIEQNGKIFYLLVNSRKIDNDAAVETSPNEIRESLTLFWDFLRTHGRKEHILLPVIGTGRGKVTLSREDIVKFSVQSFLQKCSDKIFCEDLLICIFDGDLKRHSVDLESLEDYLRSKCIHYEE